MIEKKKLSIGALAVTGILFLILVGAVISGAASNDTFPWGIFRKDIPIDTAEFPLRENIEKIEFNDSYVRSKVRSATMQFYAENPETQWLNGKRPSKLYEELRQIINSSDKYGLSAEGYDWEEVEAMVASVYENEKPDEFSIATADIIITARFLQFCIDLSDGRVHATRADDGRSAAELAHLLSTINGRGRLRRCVDDIQPDHKQYRQLLEVLDEYRRLERDHPDLDEIDENITLQAGDSGKTVAIVARRLALTDDDFKFKGKPVFDDDMAEAVKRFQARHGLEVDGVIGPSTIQYLNIPFSEWTEKIAANLDRLRWLPDEEARNHVVVNVPDFTMTVHQGGREVMDMKVIVGDEYHATPLLIDTLEYVAFSPTWTVPASIVEEEIIPRLQKDAEYYASRDYKFYRNEQEIDPADQDWEEHDSIDAYKVVQQPGPGNALGRVKFMMPNDLAIYLHDTPADHLFEEETRAYSHGCIRIEKPVEFAEHVLRDQKEWDEKKIREAMVLPEPKNVPVTLPCQVQILYQTAWVDEKNNVQFRDDLYQMDMTLKKALQLP